MFPMRRFCRAWLVKRLEGDLDAEPSKPPLVLGLQAPRYHVADTGALYTAGPAAGVSCMILSPRTRV